jgi:hypothetical protein
MPIYRIGVHGKNCIVEVDGALQRLGFYTVRIAEADNAKKAANAVLTEVEMQLESRIQNNAKDAPEISIDEMHELGPTDQTTKEAGFVWYSDHKK